MGRANPRTVQGSVDDRAALGQQPSGAGVARQINNVAGRPKVRLLQRRTDHMAAPSIPQGERGGHGAVHVLDDVLGRGDDGQAAPGAGMARGQCAAPVVELGAEDGLPGAQRPDPQAVVCVHRCDQGLVLEAQCLHGHDRRRARRQQARH